MRYTKDQFIKDCKREFSFLENDYDFSFINGQSHPWGYKIFFKNQTTGIIVALERRDFRVFVDVCRLVRNDFSPGPGEITPGTVLNNYSLGILISIRSPQSLLPSHQLKTLLNNQLIEKMLSHEAMNLKNYAQDILSGDFSVFPQLDRVVKDNAKSAAILKWGKDACKYGW